MVDRSGIDDKVIVTLDRGYECYNNMAHIEQSNLSLQRRAAARIVCHAQNLCLTQKAMTDFSIHRFLLPFHRINTLT